MNATPWCARETGPSEVYRFMSAHQGRFRVTGMARVLGVSTSGYYAWRGRPPSARARADAELTTRVQKIHAGSRGRLATWRRSTSSRPDRYPTAPVVRSRGWTCSHAFEPR